MLPFLRIRKLNHNCMSELDQSSQKDTPTLHDDLFHAKWKELDN